MVIICLNKELFQNFKKRDNIDSSEIFRETRGYFYNKKLNENIIRLDVRNGSCLINTEF